MFETESRFLDDANEQIPESGLPANARGDNPSWSARRRIERLSELRRLRALLDDPYFDDLD